MKNLLGVLFSLLIFSSATATAGTSVNAEIKDYIKTFKTGSHLQQERACQTLEWAGLSDTRIFDLVEKNLLAGYQNATSKAAINEMSWLVKALGFSGQEKYRNTIDEVAASGSHKKLRKYAVGSSKSLAKYTKWNAIISNRKQDNSKKSLGVNRLANMLRSDELELNHLATRRLANEGTNDSYLLDILMKTTQKRMVEEDSSREFTKAVADMLKVLAMTREDKYLAVVEEASTTAYNKKVKKYATKFLRKYR